MMNDKQPEQELIHEARRDFENSVLELDSETLADLAAVRRQALSRRPSSLRQRLLVPASALVLLCVALATYNILAPRPYTSATDQDALELLSILEGLDFYDDVEFYEWLEDQGYTS
ncbi:MAG: hypothetical protein ACRESK_02555 [Gammaproteobacteria bacterium]